MRTNIGKSLAASAMALTIVGGLSTTAFAETGEPAPPGDAVIQPGPPVEMDESGFVPAPAEEAELPPASKPSDSPNAEHCTPKNVYRATANHGRRLAGIGATQSNYNATSRTARSWFKARAGGEVTLKVSGELKVSANSLIGTIEATYNVGLEPKIYAEIGNEMQVDTPPHKTTNGKYGVWRLYNSGVSYTIYSNCQTSAKSTVTSLTPWYVGWHLWES